MPLYQKSVVAKYLKSQNKEEITSKWKSYSDHFLNPRVQEDIKGMKEEQYQGEFLEDLFVKILGYTKPASSSSETKFNLTTEYKNVKDSKKADGAIIFEDKVKAVIELKGTNTTDLGKIEVQAFGYKNNQPDCVYVITSNFEKLRFYIDNAIEHIEFNLFTLTEEEFQLLYICLGFDNLSKNIAKKIKDESLSEEDVITKKLYKDYSLFKRELHQNLVLLNPGFEPLELFKKSQKLIDRFLFLFFGEDRHLLPPNSVRLILSDWRDLQERDVEIPLYDRFKKYFEYLNTGYKGKRYDVFAYNGGLFKPDEVLDTIKIDDELLFRHTFKLAEYDFASEVDVNILGHIFENSLNELDEVKAQLEGTEIDKTKTKRKKDGVFYTPKYITKYIVDNTIGKLCSEKKVELNIIEEDYFTDKKRQKKTIQPLLEKLSTYRAWLLQLTICDPACGSGAFLNQALDFLITEHKYIDELQAKLFGDALVMSDVEKSILENNLFGVDLNEESVEIAKLSLWLRTAQPNRKLNDLNNNIKCGNSLIDDVAVAGDKAFNWQTEFPVIFEKGGFDVIIGNPPYVSSREISENQKEYFYKRFKTSQYRINLYTLFCELIFSLLNPAGKYSLIIPNYWLSTQWDSDLRVKITKEHSCIEILNTYEVFEEVNVDTVILIGAFKKSLDLETHLCAIDSNLNRIEDRLQAIANKSFSISTYWNLNEIDVSRQIILGEDDWGKTEETLDDALVFTTGMQPYEEGKGIPIQTQEMRNNKVYHSTQKLDETYLPLLGASNVQWLMIKPFTEYIKYGTNLSAMRNPMSFKGERILMNRILSKQKIDACLISEDDIINNSDIIVLRAKNDKINMFALLGIITSRYCAYSNKGRNINLQRKVYPKLNVGTLKAFPLPKIEESNSTLLEDYVTKILTFNKQEYLINERFGKMILASNQLIILPRKLQNWQELEFGEFIQELNKAIKASNKEYFKADKQEVPFLTKKDEFEWLDIFEENKQKFLELKTQRNALEKQIDAMVYKLYGLSEEEIGIVENS